MSDFKKLKEKEVLSETQFYIVEKVVGDQVQLKPDNGESIIVNAGYVNSMLSSGEQYTKEDKVTRTEMADIMMNNARTAMTVNFNKQVKEADVTAELEKEVANAYANSTPGEFSAKVKKAVKDSIKKTMQGEERTMVGRHYGSQDEFGRVHFIDMSIAQDKTKSYDVRQRLIDPRTLNWIIVGDVKYTIKK